MPNVLKNLNLNYYVKNPGFEPRKSLPEVLDKQPSVAKFLNNVNFGHVQIAENLCN